MPEPATTFRIEPSTQNALRKLSSVMRRPMNQLVNEAVKVYVERRSLEVERELEDTLVTLRSIRAGDPLFEGDIAAFAKAESGHRDPVEGRPVRKGKQPVVGIQGSGGRVRAKTRVRTKSKTHA